MRRGPTNSLLDVGGLRVGHATRVGEGWLSGVTVVLPPAPGAVAGVAVRGGGPGTRETDLLDPRNTVERVHALVFSGGSAYGLAAADGVMTALADDGVGFSVGAAAHEVVPIVPQAVIFDLGRGGDFGCRPGAELGRLAYAAARGSGEPLEEGCVGAGTGAVAGGLKGGVGSASVVLATGGVVGALAVVNAVGSVVDADGRLYGERLGLPGEFPSLSVRVPADAPTAGDPITVRLNTTVGVVATDVPLTKAQCAKLASVAHDGLARAIRPAHTMLDGDTIFAISTAAPGGATADLPLMQTLLGAAADCFARAVAHGVLSATSVTTPAGTWRSYRDTFVEEPAG